MRGWFPPAFGGSGGGGTGATGATGATGPTGATGATGPAGAGSLVFSPGGTAGGNVFTTEATLAAATAQFHGGAYTIFFDLSHVADAYAFTTVGALALAPGGTWTDSGLGYALTFSAGTTLPAPPTRIEGALQISVTQSVPLATVTAGFGTTDIVNEVTVAVSGAGPFLHVVDPGEWIVFLKDTATIGGGSNTERAITSTVAFDANLTALDSSTVGAFAVDAQTALYIASPGVLVEGGADSQLYTEASIEGLMVDRVGGANLGIPPANGKAFLFDVTTGLPYYSNAVAWTPFGIGTYFAAYAARPAPALAGRRFVASDPGVVEFIDDGTAWRPLILGCRGNESAPNGSTAGYTFTNSSGGGSSLAQSAGVARIFGGGNSGTNAMCTADKPRSAGQGVLACLLGGLFVPQGAGTVALFGVHFRDSTTGALQAIHVSVQDGEVQLQVTTYTNANTFGANLYGPRNSWFGSGAPIWLRITDDGANWHFDYSFDGVNFAEPIANTLAAGFDFAGFHVNPVSASVYVDALSLVVS